MRTSPDRRRKRVAQPARQSHGRNARRQSRNSGAPVVFGRKQIAIGVIGAVVIAMIGLFSGIWAVLSQNLETRILKKAEHSELLINEISRRLEQSDALRKAIADRAQSSGPITSRQTTEGSGEAK